MKKMMCFALTMMFLPLTSMANTNDFGVRCTLRSAAACEKALVAEMKVQKCEITESSLRCNDADANSRDIYCNVVSSNCSEASSNGFTGVICQKGSNVSFKNRAITGTWARSILWIWVKEFCKQ